MHRIQYWSFYFTRTNFWGISEKLKMFHDLIQRVTLTSFFFALSVTFITKTFMFCLIIKVVDLKFKNFMISSTRHEVLNFIN